jgi:hypothetical protein
VKTYEELRDEKFALEELRARRDLQRILPKESCGAEPCHELCAVGYKDQPGPPMMIARKGNPKYPRGGIHPRCMECDLRARNATAICGLEYQLGLRK